MGEKTMIIKEAIMIRNKHITTMPFLASAKASVRGISRELCSLERR